MKTVSQQIKERATESAQTAQGYRIFKVRLPDDDGWQFFTAKNLPAAKRARGKGVASALPNEVYEIAVRALMGMT